MLLLYILSLGVFYLHPILCCTFQLGLIAISNSLDLFDQIISEIPVEDSRIRLSDMTVFIPYAPYSVDDLRRIVAERFRSVDLGCSRNETDSDSKVFGKFRETITSAAIELCIRRVASASGDVRKVLDVLSHLVAQRIRKLSGERIHGSDWGASLEDAENSLQTSSNLSTSLSDSLPPIHVHDMKRALDSIFGGGYVTRFSRVPSQSIIFFAVSLDIFLTKASVTFDMVCFVFCSFL